MLLLKFMDLCILLIVFCEIFIRIYNKFSFFYIENMNIILFMLIVF